MEAIESKLPGASLLWKIAFPILMLVALYYLYQFLFGANGLEGSLVMKNIRKSSPDKPYIFLGDPTSSSSIPAIYEGGEYTINGWIYIDDYSIRRGYNKHVVSLGGSSFLTLAVFLGPYKNSLNVRVHTQDTNTQSTALPASSMPTSTVSDDLKAENLGSIFTSMQQDNGLLNPTRPCDIQSIDLQKWVQITITLNNKTCDVFIDGKLARSCVLPSFYKVSKSNMALRLCEYGGFGGYVSNFSAYNYALNPEQIWRLYMSGPGPQLSIADYIAALFDPKAAMSVDYPKQNITA
jgi:hypothetical protein